MARVLDNPEQVAKLRKAVWTFEGQVGSDFAYPEDSFLTEIILGERLEIKCSLCLIYIGQDRDGTQHEEKTAYLSQLFVRGSFGKKLLPVILCRACVVSVSRISEKVV